MPGRSLPVVGHGLWIGVAPHIGRHVGDPTRAWQMLAPKQTHVTLPLEQFVSPGPQPPGTVRFVCVSDTHGSSPLRSVPDGDVLLHAGDWSQLGGLSEVSKFCSWIKAQPHKRKIVIAGNHDLLMDRGNLDELARRFGLVRGEIPEGELERMHLAAKELLDSACEYLCDSGTEVEGIQIWGSPWQPWFCDWAFNLPRGKPCRDKWKLIPTETDVLITHGPALGHGDLCSSHQRAGCLDLLDEV